MPPHNIEELPADAAGIEHILRVADLPHLPAHDSRETEPARDAHDERHGNHISRREHRRDDEDQQDARDRTEELHDAHEQTVHAVGRRAAERAVGNAEQRHHGSAEHADRQGRASAVKHDGKQVAAERVGAEVIFPVRGKARGVIIVFCGVVICDVRREDAAQHDHQQDYRREDGLALQALAERGRLLLRLMVPPACADDFKIRGALQSCFYHWIVSISFMRGSISSLIVCAMKLDTNTAKPVISTSTIRRL